MTARCPNNPRLPFVVYRRAIDVPDAPLGEEVIERVFDKNGWGDMWRNGVYPYAHYHSQIHEAMGVARGRAKVRFGGDRPAASSSSKPGDVAILPAGTGHQCLKAARDFVVVGAYPPDGEYDLCRARKAARKKALETIPQCRCRRRIRCSARRSALNACGAADCLPGRDRAMADWISFWDSDAFDLCQCAPSRRALRADCRGHQPLCAFAPGVVLDYGCGEALHAERVAAAAGRLILCEAAPNVRVASRRTLFRRNQHRGELARAGRRAAGRLARSRRHAFGRAISHAGGADALFAQFRRLLKPGGLFVLGDVIPPHVSPLTDAVALLRFAAANGFFIAALFGLVRTTFSDYPKLRAKLGLTLYEEVAMRKKLEAAGFRVERAPKNIGHSQARMTFLARPR